MLILRLVLVTYRPNSFAAI